MVRARCTEWISDGDDAAKGDRMVVGERQREIRASGWGPEDLPVFPVQSAHLPVLTTPCLSWYHETGVFLCLDCSATHRSMGVHTSFVRSVDLDEWTQSQIDAMRLGGNGVARTYFRKHGFSDMHGKIEKKYQCKAAQLYRTELQKLVDADAAKRGEGPAAESASVTNAATLLDSLDLQEQADQAALAKDKLAAVRASNVAPAQPTAVLASQLPGARGKLLTPPSSGNAPTLVLRKPASSASSAAMTKNLLKKKPSGTLASKLRVNKLTNAPGAASNGGYNDFEYIEATQKAAAETEKEATQLAQDEALARQLEKEMNNGTTPTAVTSPVPEEAKPSVGATLAATAPTQSPVGTGAVLEKKPSSMEEQVARLKMLNSDFFADA